MADRPPLEVPTPTAQHATWTRPSPRLQHLTDAFCDTCRVVAGPLHADEASAWVWGHLAAGGPASLPLLLSSVDDVARVCEAAGLQRVPMLPYADRWLGDLVDVHVFVTNGVLQRSTVLAEAPATQKLVWHIEHGRNAPASSLWSAIQAAQGGEPS